VLSVLKHLLGGNLEFIFEPLDLCVIVDTNAVKQATFEDIRADLFWSLFDTLQEEVHAVLKCDWITRTRCKVDSLHTLRLSVIVVDLLQIVFVHEMVLN